MGRKKTLPATVIECIVYDAAHKQSVWTSPWTNPTTGKPVTIRRASAGLNDMVSISTTLRDANIANQKAGQPLIQDSRPATDRAIPRPIRGQKKKEKKAVAASAAASVRYDVSDAEYERRAEKKFKAKYDEILAKKLKRALQKEENDRKVKRRKEIDKRLQKRFEEELETKFQEQLQQERMRRGWA